MIKPWKSIKILGINILVISISSITIAELYLRIYRPKLPIEVQGKSYLERLKKAKKDSSKNKLLTLVIGDSFAHHQIGSNGNFFDTVFNCKDKAECNYHNLAQSGVDLEFYWNTILSILNTREKNANTRIILSIYFGNDIPLTNASRKLSSCKSIHIIDPKMTRNLDNSLILSIKRKLPSLLLIARSLKISLGIGAKTNSNQIISNAYALRPLRIDPQKKLQSIEDLISKIDPLIIKAANRSTINPWELSLALANPYYYDELYNLESDWSKRSVKCLSENLISNITSISYKHPNTEFLVIGIPDKFFWSQVSYKSTILEYEKIGYKFKEKQNNLINNPLYLLVSKMLGSEQIRFLYLPSLISRETDISDWFYYRDMHINANGNRQISELLKTKKLWK